MGLFGFGKKTEKVTKEVTEGCCCGFVSEEKIVDEPVCGCDGPIREDKTYVAEEGCCACGGKGCNIKVLGAGCKSCHEQYETQIPRSVISRLTPAPSFPWTGRCIFDLQKPL